MTKPVTVENLSDELDRDLVWRVRELSALKLAIRNADANGTEPLLRALIAMMYAHWEGYVKFCATKYFQYITMRRFKFSELEPQIYINSFLSRIDSLFRSKESMSQKCVLVSDILASNEKRFSQLNPSLIDTKSNLNSDVLRDICVVCAISYDGFKDETNFLDVILLKRRNAVAHGQAVDISIQEIDDLVARTMGLMRQFRSLLENKVYQASFKAALSVT